jgi:hypothetical protein
VHRRVQIKKMVAVFYQTASLYNVFNKYKIHSFKSLYEFVCYAQFGAWVKQKDGVENVMKNVFQLTGEALIDTKFSRQLKQCKPHHTQLQSHSYIFTKLCFCFYFIFL